jgi:hypothetical protein
MLTCHECYKIALFCGLSPPLDKSRTVVTVSDTSDVSIFPVCCSSPSISTTVSLCVSPSLQHPSNACNHELALRHRACLVQRSILQAGTHLKCASTLDQDSVLCPNPHYDHDCCGYAQRTLRPLQCMMHVRGTRAGHTGTLCVGRGSLRHGRASHQHHQGCHHKGAWK